MVSVAVPSLSPLSIPVSVDDRIQRLRLLRSRRVGIATYRRLMGEYGSAAAALDALPEIAKQKGVAKYEAYPQHLAEREYFSGRKAGAELLHIGEPNYPRALADLSDAPPLLWAMGRLELMQKPAIALVGARNASSLGTRIARKLAGDLSDAGFAVVSGLARGIDAAAHDASKANGTIAVHAGGVDIVYPAENNILAQAILENGLRVSEHPINMTPTARHFPSRNRIISGMSAAVIVVEAAAKSGSLITARQALDQGRDVLAVPGHPIDARAAGCNMLIRDGATLVRNVDDILEQVPLHKSFEQPQFEFAQLAEGPAPAPRPLRETANLHGLILGKLSPSPTPEDQLIRDLCHPASVVAPAVTELELSGQIERHPGGMISKIPPQ